MWLLFIRPHYYVKTTFTQRLPQIAQRHLFVDPALPFLSSPPPLPLTAPVLLSSLPPHCSTAPSFSPSPLPAPLALLQVVVSLPLFVCPPCRLLPLRQREARLHPIAPMSRHARPSTPFKTRPPSLTLTLPSMSWMMVPKFRLRNAYAKVIFALELRSVQAQSMNAKFSSSSLNNQRRTPVTDLGS